MGAAELVVKVPGVSPGAGVEVAAAWGAGIAVGCGRGGCAPYGAGVGVANVSTVGIEIVTLFGMWMPTRTGTLNMVARTTALHLSIQKFNIAISVSE